MHSCTASTTRPLRALKSAFLSIPIDSRLPAPVDCTASTQDTPDVTQLIDTSISSTHSALLARLLEELVIPGTGRSMCENRGFGVARGGSGPRLDWTEAPELNDRVRELVISVRDQRARLQPPWGRIADQLISLLEAGPRSSVDLTAALGTSKQTVLNWLRRFRTDGIVVPTDAEPHTRGNKQMLFPLT